MTPNGSGELLNQAALALVLSAVGLIVMTAIFVGVFRWFQRVERLDERFFGPARVFVRVQLARFAHAVGGALLPPAGPRAAVHCEFRGFQVEVGSVIESLNSGKSLLPRVVIRLRPWQRWQRLPCQQFAYDTPESTLWRSGLDGQSDRAVSTLTAREQGAFDALAALSCHVECSSPLTLDVRARPAHGLRDQTGRRFRDDFELEGLTSLVERSATFAEAALEEL